MILSTGQGRAGPLQEREHILDEPMPGAGKNVYKRRMETGSAPLRNIDRTRLFLAWTEIYDYVPVTKSCTRSFHFADDSSEAQRTWTAKLSQISKGNKWLGHLRGDVAPDLHRQLTKQLWMSGVMDDSGPSNVNVKSWSNHIKIYMKGLDLITGEGAETVGLSFLLLSARGSLVCRLPSNPCNLLIDLLLVVHEFYETVTLHHLHNTDTIWIVATGFIKPPVKVSRVIAGALDGQFTGRLVAAENAGHREEIDEFYAKVDDWREEIKSTVIVKKEFVRQVYPDASSEFDRIHRIT